ncbi:TIGR00730 family Rossman fold protein [Solicola sp. PLA-1-18]|uniref:LOG family protein n=1 Tax=Solicola sp. PLA-1-18 TaxID=3380532 RepID=UPI003B7BCD1B
MSRVCVFTGSAHGTVPAHADAARALGTHLAACGVGLVYGGGHVGLMGVVADAVMDGGGEAIGVIPQGLFDREVGHHGLTSLEVVPDMHTRKARMAELCDVFVALPGGLGTLEELFEVWTWRNLGIHPKPVVLYDVDGFWTPLRDMVARMVDVGFVSPSAAEVVVVTRPEEVTALL